MPSGVPTVTSSMPKLARYVARIWRYSGCTLRAVTTRPCRPVALHGHQHGFGRGAAAVVQAGVRDIHAGQLGDQRLIFEEDLQVALAGLGLIGRVRRVELAARADVVDDRRNEMVVAAAAQEADLLARRAVALGESDQVGGQFELGQCRRNVERPLAAATRAESPRTARRSNPAPIASSIAADLRACWRCKAWYANRRLVSGEAAACELEQLALRTRHRRTASRERHSG